MGDMLIQKDKIQEFASLIKAYLGNSTICEVSHFDENIAEILNLHPSSLYCAYIEGSYNKLIIPDKITSIAPYAFHQQPSLTAISLPDSITRIGSEAFFACINLELESLPSNLVEVDDYAFYWTKSTFTSIPASVAKIGNNAFCYNEGLTEITFEGTPANIHDSAFYGCSNLLTINVPWSEGEVAGAPWGATNATINYNYVAPSE